VKFSNPVQNSQVVEHIIPAMPVNRFNKFAVINGSQPPENDVTSQSNQGNYRKADHYPVSPVNPNPAYDQNQKEHPFVLPQALSQRIEESSRRSVATFKPLLSGSFYFFTEHHALPKTGPRDF
jgi:hypothetical protein